MFGDEEDLELVATVENAEAAIEARLKATARDLGQGGPDARYGAGLLDAAAATWFG